MLWNRKPAPAPSERGERGSVSLVDDALEVAARRELFTRDEALGLLRRIELDTRGHAGAATVERIVVGVDLASADQAILSRTELVDPLLDIRLVLCP
jgi:hypothetical protein